MEKHTLLLDKFKTVMENSISNARIRLTLEDGFYPMVISSTFEGIQEAEIDFEETSKDESAVLLRKYATSPDVEAIGLIFMGDVLVRDPDDKRPVADDIREEADTKKAIMVYLYTKNSSSYRRVLYDKHGDDDYTFIDEGWRTPKVLEGRFANPFTA